MFVSNGVASQNVDTQKTLSLRYPPKCNKKIYSRKNTFLLVDKINPTMQTQPLPFLEKFRLMNEMPNKKERKKLCLKISLHFFRTNK